MSRESKWLTEEEAKGRNQERDNILKFLSGKVNYGFKQSKVYLKDLSPGCLICGKGKWSCIFINSLCTTDCFFCPQDRSITEEKLPNAEETIFDNPDDYVDYLEKFGIEGVGFSGGEPLLVFDKLLLYIKKIRQKFGKKNYIWLYTNGDLVTADNLKKLKEAGLDEIRFNISAMNYDLTPAKLATKFIDTVSVEIPVIPEDYEVLKRCILEMREIGVSYLNIHQLYATEYNYKNFIEHNYTFQRFPGIPILESEMFALKLIKYILNSEIELSVNYCTRAYKFRFQGRGKRRRLLPFIQEDFEGDTDSGLIRRLSIKDKTSKIERIVDVLRKNKSQNNLWLLDDTNTELFIHHSLLEFIDFKDYNLILRYFEPELKQDIKDNGDYKAIRLNLNKNVYIKRKFIIQAELSSLTGIRYFQRLIFGDINEKDMNILNYFLKYSNIKTKADFEKVRQEIRTLASVKRLEKLDVGFPKIY